MRYQAVLFDFDGVLGNTMQDNYNAWKRAFNDYKIQLVHEEYFLLEGLSTKAVATTLLNKEGMNLALAKEIADLKEKYYLENNQFNFFPGALELVAELREKCLLGLVSGSGTERLRRTTSTDFLAQFQVVITGDVVERSKPDPESYLTAAKQLGMHPDACLVIENAPLGIHAAKSAGMVCIAVCSTLTQEKLQDADMITTDLHSLRHLLNHHPFFLKKIIKKKEGVWGIHPPRFCF